MRLAQIFMALGLAAVVQAGTERPLELKVLRHRTALTSNRDASGPIGYLSKGQAVTVLELGEKRHRVVARLPVGYFEGWVDAEALEAVPGKIIEGIQHRSEKATANRELIAQHEVGSGMTRDEVRAALGNPDSHERTRLPDGTAGEQWSYFSYRYLPTYVVDTDPERKSRRIVSYQRKRAGRKIITFRDGEVVAVQDELK